MAAGILRTENREYLPIVCIMQCRREQNLETKVEVHRITSKTLQEYKHRESYPRRYVRHLLFLFPGLKHDERQCLAIGSASLFEVSSDTYFEVGGRRTLTLTSVLRIAGHDAVVVFVRGRRGCFEKPARESELRNSTDVTERKNKTKSCTTSPAQGTAIGTKPIISPSM